MHSKGIYKQNEKTIHRMGEDICKPWDQQRINLQNIQAAHAVQNQKNKQTNQKVGRGPKQIFLQREQTDG